MLIIGLTKRILPDAITLDLDKEQNATFLDLLKKKAGKKGSMKRKKLNLTVFKEVLREMIREEIKKLKTG